MRNALLLSALALALTACSQGAAPARPSLKTCAHAVALPNVTVEISEHESRITLKPGAAHALVFWQAGEVRGSDHVYPSNSPDTVRLGCLDGITFSE